MRLNYLMSGHSLGEAEHWVAPEGASLSLAVRTKLHKTLSKLDREISMLLREATLLYPFLYSRLMKNNQNRIKKFYIKRKATRLKLKGYKRLDYE